MSHTTVTIPMSWARSVLGMIGVSPVDGSPLAAAIASCAEGATRQELTEHGLIIDDQGGGRPNSAVGLALATLAQPQELVDLQFSSVAGERWLVLARVGDHRVLMRFVDDSDIEITFPVNRVALVAAIRESIVTGVGNKVALDLCVSPVGQFLIGTMAGHGRSGWISAEELSAAVDQDILTSVRALGLMTLDPSAPDHLRGDSKRVESELDALAAQTFPAVVASGDGRYALVPQLADVLGDDPNGSLQVNRRRFTETGVLTTLVTALRLQDTILVLQFEHDTNGSPIVRIHSATDVELATIVGGLLFEEQELAVLMAE